MPLIIAFLGEGHSSFGKIFGSILKVKKNVDFCLLGK